MKEFTLYKDGRCCLTDDGNVKWSSDNDDTFQEEFGDTIDPEDIDDVLQYLLDSEYLEDNESLDVVDEGADDTATVETLALDELAGDFDDGDDLEPGENLH